MYRESGALDRMLLTCSKRVIWNRTSALLREGRFRGHARGHSKSFDIHSLWMSANG